MPWSNRTFTELTNEQLYQLLQLRALVFVVEQNSIYLDPDGYDTIASHLFFENEEGAVVACCRLLPPESRFMEASIGRVAVHPEWRGRGLAREMMEMAIAWIRLAHPGKSLRLSGQRYLEDFYASLGFQADSGYYLEDGIEHIAMLLKDITPA